MSSTIIISESPGNDVGDGDVSELEQSISEEPESLVELQNNMRVYVRVRPMLEEECSQGYKECFFVKDDHTVQATAPSDSNKYKAVHGFSELFKFSKAFDSSVNQVSFFEESMTNIIIEFLKGQNCLVFAYGSSGSGKTYSIQGTSANPGVIPLTIQLLFEVLETKIIDEPPFKPLKFSSVSLLDKNDIEQEVKLKAKLLDEASEYSSSSSQLSIISGVSSLFDTSDIQSALVHLRNTICDVISIDEHGTFSIWMSFAEVYNEHIYDLLKPPSEKREKLNLGEQDGGIYIKGLTEINIKSVEEALKLIIVAKRNLKIASTKLNFQSSRSHSIFNLKLVQYFKDDKVRVNNFSFCDLAGSERCCKTDNQGMRLKEAATINRSLLTLGRCLHALRKNQVQTDRQVIPFRESKLTRLFTGFFTGNGYASMLVNISPSSYTFDESLNVLKFSAVAREIVMEDLLSTKAARLSQEFNTGIQNKTMDNSFDFSEEEEDPAETIIYLKDKLARYEKFTWDVIDQMKEIEIKYHEALEEKEQLRIDLRFEISQQLRTHYDKILKRMRNRYATEREEYQGRINEQRDFMFDHLMRLKQEEDEIDECESDYMDIETAEASIQTDAEKAPQLCRLEEMAEVKEAEFAEKNKEIEKLILQLSQLEDVMHGQEKQKSEELMGKDKEITHLRSKTNELTKTLEQMTAVRTELEEKNKEIEKLNSQLNQLHDAMRDEEKQKSEELMEKDKEITHLQSKTNELTKTLEQMAEMRAELEEKNKEIEKLNSQLNQLQDAMRDEAKEKDEEITKLRSKTSELTKTLEQKAEVREAEIADKNKEIEKLNLQLKQLQDTMRCHEKQKSEELMEKDKEITHLLSKTSELTKSLEQNREECDKLRAAAQHYNDTISSKDETIQKMQVELMDLEKISKRAEEQCKNRSAELENANRKIELQKKIISDLETQVSDFIKSTEASRKSINIQTDVVKPEVDEKKFADLQNELDSKKQEIRKKEEELLALEKDSKKQVNDMINQLSEVNTLLTKKSREVESLEKALENQAADFVRQVSESEKKLFSYERASERKFLEIQKQLNEKDTILQQKEEEMKALRNTTKKSIEELQNKLNSTECELSAKAERVKSLEQRLMNQIDSMEKLQQKDNEMSAKLEKMKAVDQSRI